LLGASHMLTGAYFSSDNEMRIDARLVEIMTGKIVMSKSQKASQDDLFTAVNSLVEQLAQNMELELTRMEKRELEAKQKADFNAFRFYSNALAAQDAGDLKGAQALLEKAAKGHDERDRVAKELLQKDRGMPIKLVAMIDKIAKGDGAPCMAFAQAFMTMSNGIETSTAVSKGNPAFTKEVSEDLGQLYKLIRYIEAKNPTCHIHGMKQVLANTTTAMFLTFHLGMLITSRAMIEDMMADGQAARRSGRQGYRRR
jgi:hypothetical protein